MNAFFPCYEDPAAAEDTTSAEMRAQLRSMYQWIDGARDGEPNVKIVPPRRDPPAVLVKHVKAAATDLQKEIQQRQDEELARQGIFLMTPNRKVILSDG
jgi:hypothetical protein